MATGNGTPFTRDQSGKGRPRTEAADYFRFLLRMPEEMASTIKARADADYCPMNAYILRLLRDALVAHAPAVPPRAGPITLADVQAFKQALADEGLVIVPLETLQRGRGEESSTPVPVPFDPMADSMASIMAAMQAGSTRAAIKHSTLKVGKAIPGKAPVSVPRASGGKTDPAIVKAIQAAWKSGTVTQADLAVKYGMDAKRIWYLVNRAPQLVYEPCHGGTALKEKGAPVTDYARELKVIRDLLALTQAEFAALLGVQGNSVMRYENGFRQVPEPLLRLARQLVRLKMP